MLDPKLELRPKLDPKLDDDDERNDDDPLVVPVPENAFVWRSSGMKR